MADRVIPPVSAPRCPYCASTAVVTSQKPSPSSYCRCDACGQLWHPDRLPQYVPFRGARR